MKLRPYKSWIMTPLNISGKGGYPRLGEKTCILGKGKTVVPLNYLKGWKRLPNQGEKSLCKIKC